MSAALAIDRGARPRWVVPIPANDAPVFRDRRGPRVPNFGNKVPLPGRAPIRIPVPVPMRPLPFPAAAVPRILPGLLPYAPLLLPLLDQLEPGYGRAPHWVPLGGGWIRNCGIVNYGGEFIVAGLSHVPLYGICNISGQYVSVDKPFPPPPADLVYARTIRMWAARHFFNDYAGDEITRWVRPGGEGATFQQDGPPQWVGSSPDPGWFPSSPAAPSIMGNPVPLNNPMLNPNIARQLPIPWTGPTPSPIGRSPAYEAAPVTQTKPIPRYWSRVANPDAPPGKQVEPGKARDRQPPRKNEKEKKALGATQKVMLGLFKALDNISEGAELVDAAYEALPKKTRDRWKCGSGPSRGLVDNAGQYGIDHADCKAKALWHNWHAMDPKLFVENVIKNALQDKFLGALNRRLPRNVGSAVDPGMKEINAGLEELLGIF